MCERTNVVNVRSVSSTTTGFPRLTATAQLALQGEVVGVLLCPLFTHPKYCCPLLCATPKSFVQTGMPRDTGSHEASQAFSASVRLYAEGENRGGKLLMGVGMFIALLIGLYRLLFST